MTVPRKRTEEREASNRTNDPKGTEERDEHKEEIDDVVGGEVTLARSEGETDAVLEHEGRPDEPVESEERALYSGVEVEHQRQDEQRDDGKCQDHHQQRGLPLESIECFL
jgi:hypothetical protein